MEWGNGGVQIVLVRKKLPSESPVLLGLIYFPRLLRNCNPTNGESRASELRIDHITINQQVATWKPTGCKFTTLRVATREPMSLNVANP